MRIGGSGPAWPAESRRARDLVLAHGWNATAYQIVNPGFTYWFAGAGDAVVGYVERSGVRVVAGAPVCAPERLDAVVREFEADARACGRSACYFAAEARLADHCRRAGRHVAVRIGAQPAWAPDEWESAAHRHRSLRAQFRRAANKGIRVAEWHPARASGSPQLRRVLQRWLATRHLPPLHFLVEPHTLERLDDRRIFVATRGAPDQAAPSTEPHVVAFTVLSPIPRRDGWLVEQFVRDPAAPNGTIELLLDHAVRSLGRDGAAHVTLGLAPLSHRDARTVAGEPPWLRLTLAWVRAHGRRFYDFGGLEAFKAKFRPARWEPVYAIGASRDFTPRYLHAIAGAFGARSPALFVAQAIGRAVRQEARWLIDGTRSP